MTNRREDMPQDEFIELLFNHDANCFKKIAREHHSCMRKDIENFDGFCAECNTENDRRIPKEQIRQVLELLCKATARKSFRKKARIA